MLQQLIDGLDVGVGQLKPLDLRLGGSCVGRPGLHSQTLVLPTLPLECQMKGGTSPPTLTLPGKGPVLSFEC